jgi:hypothetical protein
MEREKILEEAINLVQENGIKVIHPFSVGANPYISELVGAIEKLEYRIDEVKIERDEERYQTGRIIIAVYPIKAIKRLETTGEARL